MTLVYNAVELPPCASRVASPSRKMMDGAGKGPVLPTAGWGPSCAQLCCCFGSPGAELGSVANGGVVCLLCTSRAGVEAPRREKHVWNGRQILYIDYTWTIILVHAAESNIAHPLQLVNSLVWQAV